MKTLIRLAALLMLGMGAAGTATADIYVWEDADGTMHFTNSAEAPQNRDARMFVKAPPSRRRSVSEPETGNVMASDETGEGRRDSGEALAGGEGPARSRADAPEPADYRGAAPEQGPRPEQAPRGRASFAEETVSPEVEEVKIVEEEEIFTPSGYSPVDRYPGTHRWNDRYADRYPPFRAVGGGWNGWRGRRGGLSGAFYSGPSPYRVPRERHPNDRYLPSFRRKRTITYRRELRPGSGPPFSRQLRQLERAPEPPPWE
jgi:hypothetical protein